MNKKVNTALFLIGATIFNLLIIFILSIGSMLLIVSIFGQSIQEIFAYLFIFVLIGSLVASFFIYGVVMKKITAKIDMEKYFHPIFKKRQK